MLKAPTDPARFRRLFVRTVLLPIALIVSVVVGAAFSALYWAAATSDDVSLQRQANLTRLALTSSADQLAYEQQGIAMWDQLSAQLSRPRLDQTWLNVEVGQFMANLFRHDMTFILDAKNRPIYGFTRQGSSPSNRFAAIEPDLIPMINAVREGSAGQGQARSTHRHATSRTRLDAVFESYATRVAGRPAAASVMLINSSGKVDATTRPVMVSVRFLDTGFLREVAAWNMIEGLRFSPQNVQRDSETAVEFRDQAGKRVGYFLWTPELPGTKIVRVLGPTLGLLLLALVGCMVMLARSLWRSGRQLSIAVVDLQASEAQAQHLAFHDILTGLPNRALFHDRLEQALARARRGRPCAVLALDLDRFKQVNDTLGHAAGDKLIRDFASRVGRIIRVSDTVARIGGDEFAVLLDGADQPEDVGQLCERILAAMREPFDLECCQVFVGVSIGVALAPEAGTDRGDLIRKADIALYCAKKEGRDCYRLFTPSMDETVKRRAGIEDDLRRAMATEGELQIHFQPEVDAGSQSILGLEALLRWNHPTLGGIPPEQFIPVAEETGLIIPLGEWVISEVCRVASNWPDLFVAVNLSAVQFRSPDLASKVIAIAKDKGCDPRQIELEITESVLLSDDETAHQTLRALREAGFRIALDDFGTGYSSLSYLREFKVDKIKIDRSFTHNLANDPEAAAIVTSMVTLGHAMGLTVTAEGVESRDQMHLLSTAGCNELQGYLFSRALSETAINELLAGKAELKDVA